MKRRPRSTILILGVLGAVLLLDLVLPIGNLLAHVDVAGWLAALRDPGAGDALRTSILTSAITVALMTLFGVPLGYVLARASLPGKQLLIGLVFLPMVVPGLAGGILLLLTFGPYGTLGAPLAAWNGNLALTSNLAGIVLAQLYVASPFVVISSLVAFNGVDPKLEMAAAMLGDSPWQIFRRISLPLAWPGIAAGLTLAWIRALGEFGATMIVAYSPHTLPVYLWTRFESNGLTGALPIAFLLVLLAAAAVAVSTLLNRLTRSAEREHPREALAIPGGVRGNPA
jgi:molybdate/tungstate transport system permease protein